MFPLDVKSAFLDGPLEEEVYVTQPTGFELAGREDKVFRLKKALYGLKQAPRAWNRRIDSFLLQHRFCKCQVEHGVYVKVQEGGASQLLICLYVDDLLVTGSNAKEIEEFKQVVKAEFEMTDLGRLTYFLGMEFLKTPAGIVLHQRKYVTEVLRKFNMIECNAAVTPVEVNVKLERNSEEEAVDDTLFKQIVGSLRYICNIRPDICFGVGLISKFMDDPRKSHLVAAKRIMRYLKGNFGV